LGTDHDCRFAKGVRCEVDRGVVEFQPIVPRAELAAWQDATDQACRTEDVTAGAPGEM
jgi:hypothetical protein